MLGGLSGSWAASGVSRGTGISGGGKSGRSRQSSKSRDEAPDGGGAAVESVVLVLTVHTAADTMPLDIAGAELELGLVVVVLM